jgi:hypothetical protein
MVRSLRSHDLPPLATFADFPGILSQHDFGAVAIHYTTGKKERIRFFVSRLEFSRYLDVRLIGDHAIESLVRALLAGFEAFGGVPLMVVFDNPRTLVLGRNGRRIQWDETLGRVAVDYRFAPELRTVGGRKTGSARSLVRFVKRSFFRARRFGDRDDLLVQLDAWQHEMNTVIPFRTTGATPTSRLVAERGRLRPLAIPPGDYALCFPVEVGPSGRIEIQGRAYTMPQEARGTSGVLYLYPEKIRIIAGGHEIERQRGAYSHGGNVRMGHHAADLSGFTGARGRSPVRRQEKLGPGRMDESSLTEVVLDPRLTWKTHIE